MTTCRQCNGRALEIIRESIVRRGPRSFLVSWYRCSQCQDVSFKYRLFPKSGELASLVEDSEQGKDISSPDGHATSDTRLPI